MRLEKHTANISDLAFIYRCILSGARKGHYSFNAENAAVVKQMKKEIQSVIGRQLLLDNRRAQASIYTLDGKRIAVLIMSDASLNHDGVELYAISVIKQYQNCGYGNLILDEMLNRHLNFDIYARCTQASEKMKHLLQKRNFRLLSTDNEHEVLLRDTTNDYIYSEQIYLAQ